MRVVLTAALACALSGCATSPKTTLAGLNKNDAAYETSACISARTAAENHDEKLAGRAAVGLIAGAVAGPAGLLISVPSDVAANNKRAAVNERIEEACNSGVSNGQPTNALSDSRQCALGADGKMQCVAP